jgi:hypothetical protein
MEAAPQTVPAWAKLICSFSRPINSATNSISDAKASYIWAVGELAGTDISPHAITGGDYGKQVNHNILLEPGEQQNIPEDVFKTIKKTNSKNSADGIHGSTLMMMISMIFLALA